VDFVVRTILTAEATSEQLLHIAEAEKARHQREAFASTALTVIDAWLAQNIEGAAVDEIGVVALEPNEAIATILAPRTLTSEEAAAMQGALSAAVEQPVDLTVRYELGGTVQPRAGDMPEDGGEGGAATE
jgi:triosephosphate isomerase